MFTLLPAHTSDYNVKPVDARQFTLLRLGEAETLATAIGAAYESFDSSFRPFSVGFDLLQRRRSGVREILADMSNAFLSSPVATELRAKSAQAQGKWLDDEVKFQQVADCLREFCKMCKTWVTDPEAPLPDPFPHRKIEESLFLLGVTAILIHRTSLLADAASGSHSASHLAVERLESALGFAPVRMLGDFPDSMTGNVPDDPSREVCTFMAERTQLLLAMIKLSNFILHRMHKRQFRVTVLDPDFLELLSMAGGHTGHILMGAAPKPSDRSVVYHPGQAPDVVSVLAQACDLLLVRMDTAKHAGDENARGKTTALSPFAGLMLSGAPEPGPERLLHMDKFGFMAAAGSRLPVLGVGTSAIRVKVDAADAREDAILNSSGAVTTLDKLIVELVAALNQVDDLSRGSAAMWQDGTRVNFRFLDALQRRVGFCLPDDRREGRSLTPVTLDGVTRYLGGVVQAALMIFQKSQAGGCLSAGLPSALDHQIPVGVDPLAQLASAISAAYNGAHVAATHFPELEAQLNHYLARTSVIFRTPWPNGQVVPTSGGTASNNLSAALAFASAGAGVAMKHAIKDLGKRLAMEAGGTKPLKGEALALNTEKTKALSELDSRLSIDGRGGKKPLSKVTDEKALTLDLGAISAALREVEAKTREDLQKLYQERIQKLHEKHRPLIVFPTGEWVHYTLEGYIKSYRNKTVLRLPLTENAELDFAQLKKEVEKRFRDQVVPLIIPLTFCNTGLGRAGFSVPAMREFNAWFEKKYGFKPLYIVDAAQGGITLGLKKDVIPESVVEAREALGEVAMSWTVDPHKAYFPPPASGWLVKDAAWAAFATGRSVGHSYLDVGDAAALRESVQLSTPLQTAFFNLMFVQALESGRHKEIFDPVMQAAHNTYMAFNLEMVTTVIEGRTYRLVAPFEPHSGILGVCLVPVDGDMSMKAANDALIKVRKYLSEDRETPISCSKYSLGFNAFSRKALPKLKERFIAEKLDWTGVKGIEFLRFVFRQGGQDLVVVNQLPKLVKDKFALAV